LPGAGLRVAVIEDDPALRRRMKRILEGAGYGVIAVVDGERGLRVVHEHQPDVVIFDLGPSRLDLFEMCTRLRSDRHIATVPVIALILRSVPSEMLAALEAGADDFLTKPVHGHELVARVASAIRTGHLARGAEQAEAVVASLANAVEAKDATIDGHCRRLAYRATRLAAYVGLRGDELQGVAFGALLHDIGKIAMSEVLLHKTGPLTHDEQERMREHPEIGGRICDPLQLSRDFAPIIRHHHERWDGTGYPGRLSGEEIPLGARIVAIADAYDAITFGRPYRRARSHDEAVEELLRCAGDQFDPVLVPLFIEETDRLESGLPPAAELPSGLLVDRDLPVVPRIVPAA